MLNVSCLFLISHNKWFVRGINRAWSSSWSVENGLLTCNILAVKCSKKHFLQLYFIYSHSILTSVALIHDPIYSTSNLLYPICKNRTMQKNNTCSSHTARSHGNISAFIPTFVARCRQEDGNTERQLCKPCESPDGTAAVENDMLLVCYLCVPSMMWGPSAADELSRPPKLTSSSVFYFLTAACC